MTTNGESPKESPVDLLARTLDHTVAALVVSGGEPADAPTPCASWTVDILQRHLLDDLDQFHTAALGGRPDFQKPVPEFEGDRAAAFRSGADQLLAAWRGQDLDAPVELPMGTVPRSFVLSQQLSEFCVHTWDLMTATGQDTTALEADPAPAEAALTWARNTLRPEFRGSEADGKAFGPEQPAAAGAPAYQQLVAFFGRSVG